MYNDSNYLASVAKFHKTFSQPILEEPTIPSEDRCNLRIELIQEEFNELKQAIEEKNIVEIADALADLQYVLTGTILEFGLGSRFRALFEEVQRSNMSKACATEQIAHDTVESYRSKDTVTYKEQNDQGTWLVKRHGDNKVLKSIQYSPADLKPILASTFHDYDRPLAYIFSQENNKYVKKGEYRLIPVDHPASIMYDERIRQQEVEGFTFEEFDQYYMNQQLDEAAMAYLAIGIEEDPEFHWPNGWSKAMFKPTPDNRLRELVKAGALVMASYELEYRRKQELLKTKEQ